MNKFKKLLSAATSVAIAASMLSSFAITANAEGDSGSCGDNAVWSYDDGILTISGSGSVSAAAEWSSLAISRVELAEGITSVADAFSGYTAPIYYAGTANNLPEIGDFGGSVYAYAISQSVGTAVTAQEAGETGATGFKASLTNTADDEQSISSLSWNVSSNGETKVFDVVTTAVTLAKNAVANFGLVVSGLFDSTATAEIAKEYALVAVMGYEKTPELVTIGGGQAFISAPKTNTPSRTAAFTASVYDQYDALIESSGNEYDLTWEVYPTGTATNDGLVTIDSNGVVSVSQAFSTDNGVKAYDVRANVVMNNAGLRSNYAVTTLYVGNMDVIYYEPIAWWVPGTGRSDSQVLASNITLPELSTVSLNMSFGALGPDGTSNRTLALNTNSGKTLMGLQHSGSSITAWTGWTGSKDMNQSGDLGNFNNSFVLVENYTPGTNITVNFTIDITSDTVTVSCGEKSQALPVSSLSTITGLYTGMYRYTSTVSVNSITVVEPDANYLSISGSGGFAKVSGQTVSRSYELSQSVIVPGEVFAWTVSPANAGVTVSDGVLSVTDTATAGTYTVTATSTSNPEKTAYVSVEIGNFQSLTANVTGPRAYQLGTDTNGTYAVTKLTDSYGDDVTALLTPVWTSSDESVATIDSATGVLTVVGGGSTTVTATVTNGTAVTAVDIPVTVGAYYITKAAEGNTTAIDASALISDSAISGYQITTATSGGVIVSKTTENAIPASVNTTGADYVEVAPIYSYSGTLNDSGYSVAAPADTYDFNINAVSNSRFDVYVNDQMLANNMLQGGSAVRSLSINDIVIADGIANIKGADYPSIPSVEITMVKSPSIVTRTKKIYVLGDSLACIYYNGANDSNAASYTYQTGWGQVLQNYIKDGYEVVDLANSGATALSLSTTAITQPALSGQSGDIALIECGYNDRTYITTDQMRAAVQSMYNDAVAAGVTPVFVTPNASDHDYKSGVSWSGNLRTYAGAVGADCINLDQLSYDFLYGTYGDDKTNVKATYNVSDGLHSTYRGAHKMASLVASAMLGIDSCKDAVNTEYEFIFTDTAGNSITCRAVASE